MHWSADIGTGTHEQQVAVAKMVTDLLSAVLHNSEHHGNWQGCLCKISPYA